MQDLNSGVQLNTHSLFATIFQTKTMITKKIQKKHIKKYLQTLTIDYSLLIIDY